MLFDLYNCLYNGFMCIVSFKIIISMKRGVLRFISMLFLIFEKMMSRKTVLGILKFLSVLFSIFEKGGEQNHCLGILRFLSVLF